MKRFKCGWIAAQLSVGLLFLAASSGQAASLTWGADGGADGPGDWIAGTWWDGTNTNWASGADAAFGAGGSGGAVTLAGSTTVNSLTFNNFSGTYTLGTAGQMIALGNGITMNSGGGGVTIVSPIALGGPQTWLNNAGSPLTVSGPVANGGNLLAIGGSNNTSISGTISGSGGILKTDGGVVALSGNNTFAGNVTVNSGTLQVGSSGAFNNIARQVAVGAGGMLQAYNIQNAFAGSTINLSGGTVAFGRPSGAIAAGGNLVVSANSVLDSYQTNVAGKTAPFNNNTTVQYGGLDFASDGLVLILSDSGFSWNFQPAGTRSQFNGSFISHSGQVQVQNDSKASDNRGIPTLEFNNTFIRAGKGITATPISRDTDAGLSLVGTLGIGLLGGAEVLGTNSFTMFDGSALTGGTSNDSSTFDTTNGLWSRSGIVSTTITASLAGPLGSVGVNGSVSFAATNAGCVALTGLAANNSYSLQLSLADSGSRVGVMGQLAKNPSFGNIFAVGANGIHFDCAALAGTSYFVWDNVHNTAANWCLDGNVTAVALAPACLWTSTGDSNWGNAGNWAGSVPQNGEETILGSGSQGTVQLGDANPALDSLIFSNSSVGYTIAQGSGSGALTLGNRGGPAVVTVIAGSHQISAPLTLAGSASFSVAAGQELTMSGAIGGSGGLSTTNAGTLLLAGNNFYSGGTTVNAGVLKLGNDNALAAGGVSMSGGSLDLSAYGPAIATLNGSAGTIGNSASDNASLTVNNGGTFAGAIVDGLGGGTHTTSLTVGGGTLILSGPNTYSGGTNVAAGTLVVAGGAALSGGTGLTVGPGGTLIFDPSQAAAAPVTGTMPGTMYAWSWSAPAAPMSAPVPEPGTLALLLAAGAAAALAWRRRRGLEE